MPFTATFVLIAFASIRARLFWKRNHKVIIGDVLWIAPFVALLLLIGGFCVRGWISSEIGILEMGVYSVGICLFGLMTQMRRSYITACNELPRFVSWGVHAFVACATILFTSLISAWLIDYAWLDGSDLISIRYFAVTTLVFISASFILYFYGQRYGALVAFVPVSAVGFGIAQFFLLSFKGVPVMPTDLLSLETAGAVAGGYEYVLTSKIIIALCFVGMCICALSYIAPNRAESKKNRIVNILVNFASGFVLTVCCMHLFNAVKLDQVLGIAYDRWTPIATYNSLGFVPSFIEVAQDLAIAVPENYDARETESLIADLSVEFDEGMGSTPDRQAAEEQFQDLKPAIVVVMNETFTDMSIYDEIREAGYEGPQYYKSLPDTLQRGTLMVPALGGGTANTEFEFLTGNSTAFIGVGKYSYQLYDLSTSDSLVKQLENCGYSTTAMHPQNPINWKRSTAYKQLGFERFLSQDNFADEPCYHSGATDAATYDKILELLKQDSSPQFIFDVTMQNHGGYSYGTVPDEDIINLNIAGVEDQNQLTELGVYLACINHSDSDLSFFIEQLKALDRPVVLVFFGDHQPNVSTNLEYALNVNADPLEKEIKKYESTYLVWANYEVAGGSIGVTHETSSSKLAAEVLYRIGAPLSDRQKADLVLSQNVSAINIIGYRGADGLRYALDDDSPYRDSLVQMQSVQYLMFGSKVQ